MTYRAWPVQSFDLRKTGIGKATESHLPGFGDAGKSSCLIWKEHLMKPAAKRHLPGTSDAGLSLAEIDRNF
jgi:hypothetical protein